MSSRVDSKRKGKGEAKKRNPAVQGGREDLAGSVQRFFRDSLAFTVQRMVPGSKSSPISHFSIRHRWARVRIVTFCEALSIRLRLGPADAKPLGHLHLRETRVLPESSQRFAQ